MILCLILIPTPCALSGLETSDQQAKESVEAEPNRTSEEMSEAIQKVLKLKADSYHVYLREASLIVPPILKGQSWADAKKVMGKHGFAIVKQRHLGQEVHYLAKKDAVILPSGHSLDLQLHLTALNNDRPGQVDAADAVLVSEIAAPLSLVLSDQWYPEGSVLDAIVTSESVRKDGAVWPVLSRISLHYGIMSNRWLEYNRKGFNVTVEFLASNNENIAGKRTYFYVESGLDPLQSWDGKKKLLDGFTSQDTIELIREGGGNEWWHGEPETIRANKRKYLKKMD